VDVVATFTRSLMEGIMARTVLQDVELLALGPQIEKEPMEQKGAKPRATSTATLLVTPEEANELRLPRTRGN